MSSRKWLVFFGIVALIILALLNLGYRQALAWIKAELDDQLSHRLLVLAEDLAVQVDPETIAGSLSVDNYVTLYENMQEYSRTYGLADVRLLDTAFVDVLGTTADSLAVAIVSRLDYPTFLSAVSGFSAASETYRWDEGYYKSAYAPVIDDLGVVTAVIRVEADAEFFAVVEVFERGLWLSHLLSLVFVIAVGGLFFWFFRRQAAWERQLLLSEKLLAMGKMASVVAHEIRNPLSIIKATAQRLDRLEPEKQKPLLQFIPEEIDRLDGILTGYLQFADIRVQRSEKVMIAGIVKSAIEHTTRYCREKGVTVNAGTDTDYSVLADSDALVRALENLIRNAVDTSPEEGIIDIKTRISDNRVCLTVADRGAGVPKKERKKIFEPFHTTKAHGSGLGLYAAKSSVEKMGGKLAYQPREGGGSIFIIELPAATPMEKS